jgi:hypothetical protein
MNNRSLTPPAAAITQVLVQIVTVPGKISAGREIPSQGITLNHVHDNTRSFRCQAINAPAAQIFSVFSFLLFHLGQNRLKWIQPEFLWLIVKCRQAEIKIRFVNQ